MQRMVLVFALLVIGLGLHSTQTGAQDNSGLQIVFVSNRDGTDSLYLMQPDGSNQVSLTNDVANDWNPRWSPDGSRILFNSDRDGRDTLYTMNADGSNVSPLLPADTFNDYDGAWSPDGERIVFASDRALGRELFIVDENGTNLRQITDDGRLVGDPTWSPDGTEILHWELGNDGEIQLFRRQIEGDTVQLVSTPGSNNGAPLWDDDRIYFDTDRDGLWSIYRMGENGERPERIGSLEGNNGRVTMAPDGSKLAFVNDSGDSDEIYIMNPDGSNAISITENAFSDHSPDWQPAVPVGQAPPPTAIPTEEAAAPETADADGGAESSTGPAVGLNVNGVRAQPITKSTLLIDYGIRAWHEAGWTGAGQRIGVIDTAFGNIDRFIAGHASVSLPPGFDVSSYSLDNNDHGTDVLEVVHAVAPSASLYACRYDGSFDALRDCTDWMQDEGVVIINHSVGLPVLPLDGNHVYAQLVNSLFQQGIFWVNSSGNFNRGYVSNFFNDSDPQPDGFHNFANAGGPTALVITASENNPYTGTILLSWLDTGGTLVNPMTGLLERVDFDLQVVGRISGAILASGERRQGPDASQPLFEIVNVQNATEPFEIRVRNAGVQFETDVLFALFVEYADLPDLLSQDSASVVAPADATNAFTVAAVDGSRSITEYSSFGAVGNNVKPDMSAPGEIYMDDGTPFIGTSAAAPVVAGMAALLLEQDSALRVDQLPLQFTNIWREPVSGDTRFGDGIVQLGAPPSRRSAGGIIDTAPYTVFPRPDEIFVDTSFRCPGAMPSRFEVGIPGYVNYNLGLTIRNGPGEESDRLVDLPFGERFDIIGGPECSGLAIWWLVELDTGADGWLSEGRGFYLIAPESLERAQLPNSYEDTVCPNALDSQLEIGDLARVRFSNRFFFRGEGANQQMDPLQEGAIVYILGGPVCEGAANNELRWYVRVMENDNDQIGFEGWLSEGGTTSRNLLIVEE